MSVLALLVLLGSIASIAATYEGTDISSTSSLLWTGCFSYCVAWWIERDRKSRAVAAPFEYQAFVFFLWPIAAPHYLFKTRGWRGLFLGIGLVFLSLLPTIAAVLTYFAMGGEF